jgi:hypothetical protein
VFTPVLAKHSKSFSLIDGISVEVDRMQRNFEPMRKQVETRQKAELTDVTAKVVIYEAFVDGRLEAPKHLARTVHDLYFEPRYEEFRSRTMHNLFVITGRSDAPGCPFRGGDFRGMRGFRSDDGQAVQEAPSTRCRSSSR